jgi:OOP family OmpA-OmpF porin
MKMKPLPKLILFVAIVFGLVYGFRQAVYNGVIPRPNALKAYIPVKAEEITASVLESNPGNVKVAPLPTSAAVQPCMDGNTRNCIAGPVHEMEIWAWNANGGLLYATGNASGMNGKSKFIQTSKGSLMEKYGVNVRITRQDDTGQMQADLLDTAQRLASDPNAAGVKFITDMGDGDPAFFNTLNPKLAKIAPDLQTEVIATIGYSRGEDGFWGPQAWVGNCEAMRGGVTVGVLRDGDWNIALKKLGQCNIPNNPDTGTYDKGAMNWIDSKSYTDAAADFANGVACADFTVKGIGGGKIHKCADAVVTWTPGDVTVAKKKGGVVPIMTTQQSAFQMPCVLIGIRRWDRAHKQDIVNMLTAAFEGADQIRVNPAALQEFGEISHTLYNEESADYWVKYYKGVTEPDAQGIRVHLGGSSVANLADAMQSFGLGGGRNLFEATYNTFGKIDVQQYPNIMPTYPPVKDILDTQYVQAVADKNVLPTNNAENVIVTKSTKSMSSIEGRKNYSIQFASGSANILPQSFGVLNQLADDIVITKYAVAAHGHTDNTGTPDGNLTLSQARADSVAKYLQGKGVTNIIRTYPHGQEEPLHPEANQNSPSERALNRRVTIILGTIDQ